MKRDHRTIVVMTLLLGLALPRGALAQDYDNPAGVMGSGGGTSSSTNYTLSGTVGQPAADIGLSSTSYAHDAGFWPAVQALAGEAFTDLAAGLTALHNGSVSWVDYDNDGDLDILQTGLYRPNGSQLVFLYNNDGGSFTQIDPGITGANSSSAAWGDYDGDGDLDLLFTGDQVAKVYRNDGGGTFNDIAAGLASATGVAAAWGDYDNDGDLDIALIGYASSYTYISKIYRNDGGDRFTDINAALLGVMDGDVAWGDYDSDGDLDILLVGYGLYDEYVAKVYKNEGPSTGSGWDFTDIGVTTLVGVRYGTAAWGDYDNDGYLDILLTGSNVAKVYRQEYGSFTDIGAPLTGVQRGEAAWGDYDNDGDLDILLTGDTGAGFITRVYRNDSGSFVDIAAALPQVGYSAAAWGDADGDDKLDLVVSGWVGGTVDTTGVYLNNTAIANTPPAAPTNPSVAVSSGSVELSWDAVSDDQTPAAGLTYNLRVVDAAGHEIAPGHADDASGWRRLPALGNAGHNLSWTLSGLPIGAYSWAVQAVDGAFAGGAWLDGGSFTTTESVPAAATTPASHITAYNARLNGIVNPGNLETTVYFEYGLDSGYSIHIEAAQSPLAAGASDVAVSANVSDLYSDYEYHYRVRAGNSAGGPIYGADQTFTTSSWDTTTIATKILTGDGEIIFSGTGLSMTYDFTNTTGGTDTIDVYQITSTPGGTMPDNVSLVVPNLYWIIDHFGSGTFTVDLTFELGAGAVRPEDRAEPSNLKLLRRADGTVAVWESVAAGASATDHSVFFTGIISFSHYTVGSYAAPAAAPTATTLAASDIQMESATLNATVNPNNAETYVEFEWGYTTSYGNSPATASQSPVAGTAGETAVSVQLWDLFPGTEYHYRVKASNSLDISYGDDVTFWTLADTDPPNITNIQEWSDYGPWPPNPGQTIDISAEIYDEGGLQYVNLQYSRGGPEFTTIGMYGEGNFWNVEIPGYDVTPSGVIYFVEAADNADNIAYSETSYVAVHFPDHALRTDIPGSAHPGFFPAEVWRLFSVPAHLDNPRIEDALNELGERNNRRWKTYSYLDGQFIENPPDFRLGEGFWIHQRVEYSISLDVGSGMTHELEDFTYKIRPGWNLIGTPYPFRVQINLDQGLFYGPITYGRISKEGQEGWSGVEQELAPWGGYAVYNRMGSDQFVAVKPRPASGPMFKKAAPAPDGWLLQLKAVGETYADVANAIGRLAGATERLDYFDNPEPPYIDGFVSLAMERPDWGVNMPRFTSDVRSIEETDGVWDLALYVKDERGPITLSHDLQGDLPPGSRVVLLDVITRQVHDLLADDGPVTITDYREDFPYHLKVVAGSASYVDQTTEKILAELPSAFALAQNYPNPFNPDTHLRYSLIRPARVTLKVYNLLGQEVVTLVDGWQDLGHYEVIWDGRDRFGSQAATGIYFAVYMAEGRTFTRKMVMMK